MKLVRSLLVSALLFSIASADAATCPSAGCDANWLNVPGDFVNPVNNFTMNLLGGWFNVEGLANSYGKRQGISGSDNGGVTVIDTNGSAMDFTASQFDHVGPGQGTSILNANFSNLIIATGTFFNTPLNIYANGQATGTLVDNATSTQGNWTLNVHLYTDFGGSLDSLVDLGVISLSTSSSYSFNVPYSCDVNDICTRAHDTVAAGSIMDYHTGLASFVGQGILPDNTPFTGFRLTLGFQGQDPLVAPVPVPAAVWLLGSGLLGLVGVARRKVA